MAAGTSRSSENPKFDTASQATEKVIASGTPNGAINTAFQMDVLLAFEFTRMSYRHIFGSVQSPPLHRK